jgi:hypothetical protein
MKFSEQPGRYFAILLFGPFLIFCGYKYKDLLLLLLGIIFIIYELFWIIFFDPKNIYIIYKNKNRHKNIKLNNEYKY